MNARKMIDTVLWTDLKDFPQKPKSVDGSGLSRYNLISQADFIHLLKTAR
jgi:D-alanyl-D-alanine carboxypeptidase/D-alanyl-D-alanine-endopeptidase (penicillin-binding protein 4)